MKIGRVVLHDHSKKRNNVGLFLKSVFLLKEVHFNVFLEFSTTLNRNYGRKKTKNKKSHCYVCSCGHEEQPCQISFSTSS